MFNLNIQTKFDKPILKLIGISKSFPGVKALDKVNLEVFQGEIHAIVGENGAGKSTLMMIISGVYKKDDGKIIFDELETEITDTHHAKSLGISTVFQELSLFPHRKIFENIFAGKEFTRKFGLVDIKKMKIDAKNILSTFDVDFDPSTLLADLTSAERQIVEIAKALSSEVKMLIFDEPTSSLTDRETARLFNIINDLKVKGVAIIYVSHRLEEVFEIADRITVLRDGRYIGTVNKKDADMTQVVRMMVGRDLSDMFPEKSKILRNEFLIINDLCRENILKNINLKLHTEEILGIYGLVGSGRSELARCIFGIDKIDSGEIYINGLKKNIDSPIIAIKNGIGYMPEDRKEAGLFLSLAVKENIVASSLERISNFGFLNTKKTKSLAGQYVERLTIKTPNLEQKVLNLSGGNQQKVLLAKWLAVQPKILIVDEPTKGIDVGAKAEIHFLLRQLANRGVGIIMISSELPEILGMSDKILVMHEGEIRGEFLGDRATQEELLTCAYQE